MKTPAKMNARRIARVGVAAPRYVRRPSQITRRPPTKRLAQRRRANLRAGREGFFPNPKRARTRGINEPFKVWARVDTSGGGFEYGMDYVTPVSWEIIRRRASSPAPKGRYVWQLPPRAEVDALAAQYAGGKKLVVSYNELARMIAPTHGNPSRSRRRREKLFDVKRGRTRVAFATVRDPITGLAPDVRKIKRQVRDIWGRGHKVNPSHSREIVTITGKHSRRVLGYATPDTTRAELGRAALMLANQHLEPVKIERVKVRVRRSLPERVRAYLSNPTPPQSLNERDFPTWWPTLKHAEHWLTVRGYERGNAKGEWGDENAQVFLRRDTDGVRARWTLVNPAPRGARWRYEDARGVTREGIFEKFFDYGGTDVTYQFRRDDGGIDLVSGSRLKKAQRIWNQNPAASPAIARAARRFTRFTGHKAERVEMLPFPSRPKAGLAVGPVLMLGYVATRDGKRENYLHKFAPHARPMLVASDDGKALHLIGGRYSFTERGIVDKRKS